MIATPKQRAGEMHACFGIIAVERKCPPRQDLGGGLCFQQIAPLKNRSCISESYGEAAVPAGKARVKVDGPLKEFLGKCIVLCTGFAIMPEAALISGPSIEACWRPTRGTLQLCTSDCRG